MAETNRNTQVREGQIKDGAITEAKLALTNAPVDGFFLTFDNASGTFTWKAGLDAVTEIPTGAVNGVNDTYTVTTTPESGSLSVYLNGLYQEEGVSKDYQLSGSTLVFATPPSTGDLIIATYAKEGTPGANAVDSIQDADNDTKVEVEKNADEDIIRFSTGVAGEQMTMQDGSLAPSVTNDIDLGTDSLQFKDVYITGDLSNGTETANLVDISDAISKKHTSGADTTLGAMTANLNLNTHTIIGITDLTMTGDIGNGADSTDVDNLLKGTVGYIVDGGDLEITVGIKGEIRIPFDCTIKSVTLIADQSGSIVIDVNKGTLAAFPTVGSICAAALPTISSSEKSEDTSLTGWSTSLSEGDILQFEVDSVTTIERCSVLLKIIKR